MVDSIFSAIVLTGIIYFGSSVLLVALAAFMQWAPSILAVRRQTNPWHVIRWAIGGGAIGSVLGIALIAVGALLKYLKKPPCLYSKTRESRAGLQS